MKLPTKNTIFKEIILAVIAGTVAFGTQQAIIWYKNKKQKAAE